MAKKGKSHKAPADFTKKANISFDTYKKMYVQSIQNPESFWAEQAERLTWFEKWNEIYRGSFANADNQWFIGGKLNAAYNCLDRHQDSHIKNKTAIIWEGDNPEDSKRFTYGELHVLVNRFANILKKKGIQKGDRIIIYMPMIPELAVSVLACAKIGAIHSVVFGGFSPESLHDRMDDCRPEMIITSDAGYRGGKIIDMKNNVDKAIAKGSHTVKNVIVVKRVGDASGISWNEELDHWWHDLDADHEISNECEAEKMDSEDPLFILYTSGSTGKPKGVLHTTAGYLLGASLTHYSVFDHKPDDIYWCTADIGWITGHSYILYGPLSNGATSIMFEGVPTYPDAGRFWDVVDKYGVNVFYTAPTAIRALAREGTEHFERRSLKTLRLLGTVGEPINPEAWEWYYKYVGKSKCPIVDTYWQTETGSIILTNLPGAWDMKPGSASYPFFGIEPVLLDSDGKEILQKAASGNLAVKRPWPSLMRGVYGDQERFKNTYFVQFPGYYFTGDGATRDEDWYYWVTGRVDDVMNVSGHRIGSAEVESALVEHDLVTEAAVVARPHEIKGQAPYAYVTLKSGIQGDDQIKRELLDLVSKIIGKIAKPDVIHWAPALPKTRSGKIMRRILRKIAEGEFDSLGDISTLADPSVVQHLIEERKKMNL
ncbi:MAG: acetate--CoA ligase [Spirochaetia bacterium]|nr:acetate--CoA ligase [Spirochaetia bacterium]